MISKVNTAKKEHIQEVGVVRAIACLCIVFLHAIEFTVGFGLDHDSTSLDYVLLTVAGILAFGTPAFIFISELLLSHAYPDRLPKAFYEKRIKLILVPFLCMAVFYAFMTNYDNITNFPELILLNIMGNYHGWFVLVIFQFYILHQLFNRFLTKVPAKLVLSVALIVNVAYLSIFNFIGPPSDSRIVSFVWDRGHWVPFLGWIFYFCFAYYCGRNYKAFMSMIHKYKVLIVAFAVASAALVIYVNSLHVFSFGSKRIDMIPLTTSFVMLLFLVAPKLNTRSGILNLVATCSFGIYLIHYFYLILYSRIMEAIVNMGYWQVPVLFMAALFSSIGTVLVVNKLPFGQYLLGRAVVSRSRRLQTRAIKS